MSSSAPASFGLTILLGFLTALGPLATDLYLPSLPAIARYFGATSGEAQLTLSAYLVGYALGLPFYGPLSDRKGRKAVLLFGLALYGVANALSAVSPGLGGLIACRFLQGFGAAGPLVVARAVVRDLHDGPRAAQELARMGSIMGLTPVVAPLIGAGLDALAGWRANFLGVALLSGLLFLWARRSLPETLREPAAAPLSPAAFLAGFSGLLRDRRFLPFGLLAAATFSGLFAFISGSSFVYQRHFGVSPVMFALAFAIMCIGFVCGSFVSQRLAIRHSARAMLMAGACLQAAGGLVMLGAHLLLPSFYWGLSLAMAVYASGVGFSLPQSQAGAMMPFPERAGAVSSLLGIFQISVAALIGAAVGAWIDHGPIVLAGSVALCGIAALAIQPFIVTVRKAG